MNLGVFMQSQYTRTILRNKNMGQSLFKKHSKFQNFDEIFYCGMTRLRNTKFGCFYTMSVHKNHKKNIIIIKKEQSLVKRHSKFLNFDEIFYCGMTRLRNLILNYCGLCRYVKRIKPKKVVRQSLFKNY